MAWLESLQERSRALLHSPYDSVIISLAAPAILALAADPLLAIVDTAIVGQLGSQELVRMHAHHASMHDRYPAHVDCKHVKKHK